MRFVFVCLFLLLIAGPGRAQSAWYPTPPARSTDPQRSPGIKGLSAFPQPAPAPPMPAAGWVTVGPTIPIGRADAELLAPEPDSTTRRLYARHRIRGVLKLRLNRDGEVQDTVEYQAVDEQGRWTQVGPGPARVRRQWSYNRQGQCTALLEFPTPERPFTLISSYNPALQRSEQAVLQADGTRTVVSERQTYRHGDTLLTEVLSPGLMVERHAYPAYYQRSLRVSPHPDTVLVISHFYNLRQQLTLTRADYLLTRRGRLVATGKLSLPQAARAQGLPLPANQSVTQLSPSQALAALRHGQGLLPQGRWTYDAWQHLTHQELTMPTAQAGVSRRQLTQFSYNSLGQLIGRESQSAAPTATATTYTVFSYLPTGLLQAETTNAHSSKPTFYRYQYQYYE